MRINIGVLLTLLQLLTIGTTFAQNHDDLADTISHVEEVVVQGFKYKRNFSSEALSATTYSDVKMAKQNIVGIKDFSSYVPNFYMPDYGSKLTSAIYIRGIGSKINSPSVGLYVDGVPYFEKSAFDFELSEIEYIDILRGPQGTLYGRNAMGGIINIYTKAPLTNQGTNLNVRVGNYGEVRASASHYNKFSESVGFAVSANYHHNNGYFTNLYTDEKADKIDAGSARVRLDWSANDRLSFMLSSMIDISNQNGYPYAMIDPQTSNIGEVNYNDLSLYERLISTTGLTVNYNGEKAKFRSITSYQLLDDHQGIDQDFSDQSLFYVTQDQTRHQISQEFNVKNSDEKRRYDWLFGAFFFYQGVNNSVGLENFSSAYNTSKVYDMPSAGAAAYHQSNIKNIITDGLDLKLGVRFDYEQTALDYNYHYNTAESTKLMDQFDSDLSFNQLTPKISLQYRLPEHGMLYMSTTKGFKPGGFNTSFESEEDRTFDPENSWNYELGSKLNLWENRLKLEFALFYIDWRNQQIYQPLPSGQGQMLKNAGRSRSRGLEFTASINPFNRFSLQTSYGYTDAKFTKYERSGNLDYSGNFIPQVPAHTYSANGNYTWTNLASWIDRLSVDLNYKMVGRIYWNDSNASKQDSYGLLSSTIALTNNKITYSIWGNNLTNKEYMAYYFESFGNGYAQKGRPLTFGVSIAIKL